MILDNLRKAGVQNTKQERAPGASTAWTPTPGTWIQAVGEYTDAGGTTSRVAVSIGPEYGTVGPELVKEAAKEAVQGRRLRPARRLRLRLRSARRRGGQALRPASPSSPTRMNPDLAMGDELLKKTGAGNLFMVFGEPDLERRARCRTASCSVEIRGLDVYDPTTGEIRSSLHRRHRLLVHRHRLQRARASSSATPTSPAPTSPTRSSSGPCKAEIDEAAWAVALLHRQPPLRPRPQTGKIAVKVINHYGDEVLKVYECGTLTHADSR